MPTWIGLGAWSRMTWQERDAFKAACNGDYVLDINDLGDYRPEPRVDDCEEYEGEADRNRTDKNGHNLP